MTSASTVTHGLHLPPTARAALFAAKLDLDGPLPADPDLGRCILWTGALNADGYGIFRVGPDRVVRAHVYAFEAANGPVPPGYEVDHACHDWRACARTDDCPHRACVRQSHLRALTDAENLARSGCPSAMNARKLVGDCGHPLSGPTVYIHPSSGRRECLICKRLRGRGRVAAPMPGQLAIPVTAGEAADLTRAQHREAARAKTA